MAKLSIEIIAKNLVDKGAKAAKSSLAKVASAGRAIGGAVKTGALVAIGAMTALAAAGVKLLKMYEESARIEAKRAAVLEATGYAAGLTTTQLDEMAASLQRVTGVSDNVIKSSQAVLLSFKEIKGDQFVEATEAILDMSAVMQKAGQDSAAVEDSVVQVGKALNDPIKGMSALARVGVTFNDQQREQIELMQESGDIAGAQGVILKELQTEFGGAAKAAQDSSLSFGDVKNALQNMGERAGEAITKATGFRDIMTRLVDTLNEFSESGMIELWAEEAKAAMTSVTPVVSKVASVFGILADKVRKGAAFLGGFAGTQGGLKDKIAGGVEQAGKATKHREDRLAAIRAEREAAKAIRDEEEREKMRAAQERAKVEKATVQTTTKAAVETVETVADKEVEAVEETEGKRLEHRVETEDVAAALRDEKGEEQHARELERIALQEEARAQAREAATAGMDSDTTGRMPNVGGTSITPEDVSRYDATTIRLAAQAEAHRIETIMEAIEKSGGGGKGNSEMVTIMKAVEINTGATAETIKGALSLS